MKSLKASRKRVRQVGSLRGERAHRLEWEGSPTEEQRAVFTAADARGNGKCGEPV